MTAIEKAIEDLELHESGPQYPYTKYALKWGVERSTLSRRHRGVTGTRAAKYEQHRNLTTTQQQELVQYITKLSKQGLPPTKEMVQNFGTAIAGKPVSESWVGRFINANNIHLICQWAAPMDRSRHNADSGLQYKRYYDELYHKISHYNIEERLIWNMDEKGFMIGRMGRSKRVFNKSAYTTKKLKSFTHDGNREWITILATICADGSSLPPSIIYSAKSSNVYNHWVDDIPESDDLVHVGATPSGWTNDEYGFDWLVNVFDRYTKQKARRKWRLLILDGHGSHVTMKFIDYATKNRIILAIFPPHSTHTLQPLDVGLFGPLASAYSSELSSHHSASQGLLPVKKADFYGLFKLAYAKSFTESNIISSFEATGIWPMDPSPVLDRLQPTTPPHQTDQNNDGGPSELSPIGRVQLERLLQHVVKETCGEVARKLTSSIHRITTQNKLQALEIEGLRASLTTKNKRKSHGKALPLPIPSRITGGALFLSPRTIRQAKADLKQKEEEEHQKELQKAETKKLKHDTKLLKEKLAKERAEKRVKDKERKDREKAERAAKAAAKKAEREANNQQKALHTSQKGKRKASTTQPKQQKRQKRVGGDGASSIAIEAASAQPARQSRGGRKIKTPAKYR